MRSKNRTPPPKFSTAGTWHTHHVVLFDDLLNSPAYIELSAHAKVTYIILLQEYKGPYTGTKVICPYSTFESKGMRRNTVAKAINELENFGFIRCERGGLYHKPNIYHLIDKWKEIKNTVQAKERRRNYKESL